MRIEKVSFFTILIIASLFFTFVPQALAYVSTPVQSGSLYDQAWAVGRLCANYGTVTSYDANGGATNNPYFFPGVVSHSDTSGTVPYFVTCLAITVTGKKPDGSTISRLEFGDQAWLDSPQDSGSSWYGVLTLLYNTISGHAPVGASVLLQYGQQTTQSGFGSNSTATWALWRWNGWITTRTNDKGLQFRFSLHCDPDLPGVYTLNIQYHIEICAGTPNANYICVVAKDISDTINYTFGTMGSFGGEIVPIDTIGLMVPYIALTSMVSVGFAVVNRKFGKFRKRN